MAEAYAEYAYREHKKYYRPASKASDGQEQGELDAEDMTYALDQGVREFTVSAMYAAIIAARQDRGDDALRFMREGWRKSRELKIAYGKPHQYDVNMVGRIVGIEGYFGGRHFDKYSSIGRAVVELARISQTDAVLGYDASLSPEHVKRAQRKAQIRGTAARSVARMQTWPTRQLTRPVSRYLLNKFVL
jgi:hypothetical protein